MQIILSHTNLDFDGLASMIAAKKIFPQAVVVLPSKLSPEVNHFLAIYKDTFPFQRKKTVQWHHVEEVILVDTNTPDRIGDIKELLTEEVRYIVYDHHPLTEDTVPFVEGNMENVGATITLLSERLQADNIPVTPFEATVFSLGLYSDTGAFTYQHTTARDLEAGAFFLKQGANLRVVDQFREPPLDDDQQQLFQQLLENSELISLDGVDILLASHQQSHYTGHLAQITRKLLQVTGADSAFSIAEMGKKTFITARATSDRINVLPLIRSLDGGGHEKAASAMVKNSTAKHVLLTVKDNLSSIVSPSLTAKDMMSSPVRVIAPQTTIETASKMLYRYGHTGFPVVENEQLIGVISRRDVDKALHHKLGHAPVKGFMSHKPITVGLYEKIEQIRELMIEDHVGRLPVLHHDQLVGIVSRTDVIQAMHGKKGVNISYSPSSAAPLKRQLTETMRKHLSPTIFQLLAMIGEEAGQLSMRAYLIGGMVRDLLLEKENEDMDIVVEGDGISLALRLQEKYGGKVRRHDEFRTATWTHPSEFKIDLTSARTEYYDFPAALPKVELSTIKEDLFRRDFTLNAMGISLHIDEFGELLDYFHGFEDLRKGKLRILYNLSFVEDPTRILRAIRFESRLNFEMDSQTERLAIQSANNLLSVSKPRLASELVKLFYEENPCIGLKKLQKLSLTPFIIDTPAEELLAEKRFDLLYQWQQDLNKDDITTHRSIWLCYMFLLTTGRVKDLSSLDAYTLTKQDKEVLSDLSSLLFSEASLNLSNSLSQTDMHIKFASYQIEPLLGFFTLIKVGNKNSLFQYLLKRSKLKRKLDGKDLKELGLSPSPIFRKILFYTETCQLESPSLTKTELIEKVKMKFSLN
ncbi:polynucleotide adenylyltransferase [Salipaludibacillus keqinensis]|uniref:Polynucleotide adenylyltransferase n=1 Tax=Salipaludibacillus keqinensis TaxID=2045207 RepID=A0A323TN80_9BACI|nr:CBS domain-containing protein [Salipaludibacillus keqinensis]PYZ94203.1 polynucleotide adenylyltransferase [Salipaludibacillus keqinensis]